MRKRTKNLIAAILALVMLFALAVPAFAAGPDYVTPTGEWLVYVMDNEVRIHHYGDPAFPSVVVVPDYNLSPQTTTCWPVVILGSIIKNPNMTVISLPEGITEVCEGNGIENCTEIIYRGTKDEWFGTLYSGYQQLKFGRPTFGQEEKFPFRIPVKTLDGNVVNNTWKLSKGEDEVLAEIKNQALQLTEGKATETEKAYAIFKWVASNIKYDYANMRQTVTGDALYVYNRRMGVCEGYTKLSNLMLVFAGLPAAYIRGLARNGVLHAWSTVYVDGKWIVFDATWNAWDIGPNYHSKIETISLPIGQLCITLDCASGNRSCGLLEGYSCPSNLVIPDYVTNIPYEAFEHSETVTSVTIGNNVTIMDAYAFGSCPNLAKVTIPGSITKIGERAFWLCPNLSDVAIGDGVSVIGEAAFEDCTSLSAIHIPDSVTSIESYAFLGCKNITSVVIPNSVTNLGIQAFGSTGLTNASIPEGITIITGFSGCESLTSVTIPNSAIRIENDAFQNCSALTSITIPDGITSIGHAAFVGCTSLTSVTIPDSVTSIEFSAFLNCTALTSVTIPTSITSIPQYTFGRCANLKDVYYGGTEAQWKAIDIEAAGNVYLLSATVHCTDSPKPTQTGIKFTDVPADAWYAGAVNWAISKGITNGTGANTFSPLNTCTHAQIITFLYRAAGSPSVSGVTLPFAVRNAWAGDALKWAYSKNIIGSDFDEGAPCNRYAAVGYIWKAFGSPAATQTTNKFNDVAGLDSRPITWAVGKGIVNGTSPTTFSPDLICDRATIVTLLYPPCPVPPSPSDRPACTLLPPIRR